MVKKLYGVIGNPIAQSMSPLMHNQEFQMLGIDAYYQPFLIMESDLESAILGMKVMGIEGINVTSPHKTTIMPFLDEIDPLSKAIGAVNTVTRKDGRLIGYNTDGAGFVEALAHDWKTEFHDDRALIIGAGGAAKAIYYTLLSKGMKNIDICNRSIEKADNLIRECPYEGNSTSLSLQDAENELSNYSLVIQTTSIGMQPNTEESPLSLENLDSSAFVSDIIYNPAETKFLQEAKQNGAKTQNGLGMFIYQGALAFEMWTGQKPDVDRMRKTVKEHLGGTTC